MRCNSFPCVSSAWLHGVYAPLCHRVIISRCRYVFGHAVGVHRHICLAGYVDQDFAGTFREELYL